MNKEQALNKLEDMVYYQFKLLSISSTFMLEFQSHDMCSKLLEEYKEISDVQEYIKKNLK